MSPRALVPRLQPCPLQVMNNDSFCSTGKLRLDSCCPSLLSEDEDEIMSHRLHLLLIRLPRLCQPAIQVPLIHCCFVSRQAMRQCSHQRASSVERPAQQTGQGSFSLPVSCPHSHELGLRCYALTAPERGTITPATDVGSSGGSGGRSNKVGTGGSGNSDDKYNQNENDDDELLSLSQVRSSIASAESIRLTPFARSYVLVPLLSSNSYNLVCD